MSDYSMTEHEVDLKSSDMEAIMNVWEFSKWVRQNGNKLGYKVAGWVVVKGGATPNISDEDAILLDKAFGPIRSEQTRDARILWKYYILGMEDHFIGEQLGISANRVTVLRGAALKGWYFGWKALANS